VKVTDFTEGQPVPPKEEGSGDPDRGPRPDEGYIGLQNHDGGKVYFLEKKVMTRLKCSLRIYIPFLQILLEYQVFLFHYFRIARECPLVCN